MILHSTPQTPIHFSTSNPGPTCPICGKPVRLESAKTEERGRAIHEECYLLKLDLRRATSYDQT